MGEANGLPDHRIINNAIDDLARDAPDTPYASIPLSTNIDDGFRDITYAQHAAAINRAADWLEKELGSGFQNEILPYIAVSDLRYPILLLAALKINCKVTHTPPFKLGTPHSHVTDAIPLSAQQSGRSIILGRCLQMQSFPHVNYLSAFGTSYH